MAVERQGSRGGAINERLIKSSSGVAKYVIYLHGQMMIDTTVEFNLYTIVVMWMIVVVIKCFSIL